MSTEKSVPLRSYFVGVALIKPGGRSARKDTVATVVVP